MTEQGHRWRIVLVTLVVAAALAGLGARLAFLHLGPNDHLRARVERTRKWEQKIIVGRGRILDRNGDALAMDLTTKDVVADPKTILEEGHVRFIAAHLARLLQLDPAMVMSRLNRPGRRFEYVKRFVDTDTAGNVEKLKLTGVRFEDTFRRHYPLGSLMCHVIGFSNFEGVGSGGVELCANGFLRGSPGLRVSERDGRRREIYSRRTLEIPPMEGADVYLTLDHTIQYMVEKALDRALEKHNAKGAWAIVQRVRTGEILAMASRPNFDLNQYRFASPEDMRNRSIHCVYEPGSTFKVLILAAAFDQGVVKPDTVIDCEEGVWVYGRRALRDYHPHGDLTAAEVLQKSSNIGAAKIAVSLGKQRVEEYVRSFGIGRVTGVDLPGEEAGIFHDGSRWSAISVTRIAIGHEVAVTALQMLNVVSAIANDGFLMRPYVVDRIVDSQGRAVFKTEPEVLARPVRAATAELMREIMAGATEEGGTGTRAAVEGYRVAGKTGTAQKPVPGGYSDTANMASFVGFLPAEQPELSIIVVIDEPEGYPRTGGTVAAPVFREIAEQAVRYMRVGPARVSGLGAPASRLEIRIRGETS